MESGDRSDTFRVIQLNMLECTQIICKTAGKAVNFAILFF